MELTKLQIYGLALEALVYREVRIAQAENPSEDYLQLMEENTQQIKYIDGLIQKEYCRVVANGFKEKE